MNKTPKNSNNLDNLMTFIRLKRYLHFHDFLDDLYDTRPEWVINMTLRDLLMILFYFESKDPFLAPEVKLELLQNPGVIARLEMI